MVDDDGRTDDGWTPFHGHPISSPCEPNGSGELKRIMLFPNFWLGINIFIFIITIIISLCFVWIEVLAFLCPT